MHHLPYTTLYYLIFVPAPSFPSLSTFMSIKPFSFPILIPFHSIPICLLTLSSKSQQQPRLPIKSQRIAAIKHIHSSLLQYPNALFLEFLLFLLSSHGAQESSIELSPATLWSAGLIILVNAGLPVSLSLRRATCACTTRIGSWLCRCVAQPRAPFGEYFQMAEFRTVRMTRNDPSLSVTYLEQ